jgi:uncharacterized protein
MLFYPLLFVVALLYAMVGHGGASGYLALMAIWGVSPTTMKATALLLNLFVSSVAFVQFYRGGHFRWSLFWPLALASVPLAWLGGTVQIDAQLYKKLLGGLLLLPLLRLLFRQEVDASALHPANNYALFFIGGVIGYLSGLIGIGGGILLSPLLLLLRWSTQQQTAAISALFIFVNSLAGLLGQMSKGLQFSGDMYLYVLVAFTGGLLGAHWGALKMRQEQLKYILIVVLLIAVFKLFQ